MKTWIALAALQLAVSVPARADDDWAGGFLLGDHERTVLRSTVLNADNFLRIPESTSRIVGLFEGRYQEVTWRARIEANHSNVENDRKATLQELNRVFHLNDNVSLSLGKRLYALDPSYINQPLGFLQKRTDLSDPLDSLGQAEGVPMAVLSWTNARTSAVALYSRDGDEMEQSLVKLGYEFDGLGVSMLLRRASGESNGIGATVGGAAGQTVSYYASAYSARGTDRPVVNTLLEQTPATVPPQFGPWRGRDGQRYHRATVGVVYTPAGMPKVQLEYAYDGRGLTEMQYARMLEQVRLIRQLPLPADAIKGQLAAFAQMLTPQGSRRRYASLTLSQTAGPWELNGGLYAGLDDQSRIWHALADYTIQQRTHLILSLVRQSGSPESERALSPVETSMAARLRWVY